MMAGSFIEAVDRNRGGFSGQVSDDGPVPLGTGYRRDIQAFRIIQLETFCSLSSSFSACNPESSAVRTRFGVIATDLQRDVQLYTMPVPPVLIRCVSCTLHTGYSY